MKDSNSLWEKLRFSQYLAMCLGKNHIFRITECECVVWTLFYIGRTVKEGSSRNALDNIVHADMYHTQSAEMKKLNMEQICLKGFQKI